MTRAFLLILDSFGIGGAPDAADFGDEGSNTLGHIAQACASSHTDGTMVRSGPLFLPNLCALGLGHAARAASGAWPQGLPEAQISNIASWGYAIETSKGKDTPSGHWEIAGVPVVFDWGYFPRTQPAFPADLTAAIIERANLPGILGDKHASGTDIVAELGDEHVHTGKPIFYTSADSVVQIACHEDSFGLERLLELCQITRELVDPLNIGRVIARPFLGSDAATYERTGNRRDFSVPPPEPTLLDAASSSGRDVVSIGKIGDIYAHSGTGRIVKATGNDALFQATLDTADTLQDGGLAITNFVDFDSLYGHRRDVMGYAAALEAFDRQLPDFLERLRPGDMAVLTADHGCDPTWEGTDHTRECIPILTVNPGRTSSDIGQRNTFADIGQTLARHLELQPLRHGTSWIE